jgi:ADP-ribose pyrophosphatase YjhB (NUDIX family)
MSAPMQLLYKVRRLAIGLLRLRTRGVKVMLFNGKGELLLIRNSYGSSHLYLLPGGGIGWRETPEAAAAREVMEEVGLEVRQLARLSTHFSRAEGKRDTVHLFRGVTEGEPKTDSMEVSEAGFFPLDRLPENVSAATLRRISEYQGLRPADPAW